MQGVLRSYSSAVKNATFYTKPHVIGHVNDITLQPKTCIYRSPAIKASVIKLKSKDHFENAENVHSDLYYVISGEGTVNEFSYSTGDVFCLHKTTCINSHSNSVLFNVNDHPLMDYYDCSVNSEKLEDIYYKHEHIISCIDGIEHRAKEKNEELNRLGVIFGTTDSNTISKTLWCLMTKTLPGAIQPIHKHNSLAIDYCVSGEGYTMLSKRIDTDHNLIDPMKVVWTEGTFFVTPPGWWHSHHSTCETDGYLFPVQDAGLHMHLDTLGIEF